MTSFALMSDYATIKRPTRAVASQAVSHTFTTIAENIACAFIQDHETQSPESPVGKERIRLASIIFDDGQDVSVGDNITVVRENGAAAGKYKAIDVLRNPGSDVQVKGEHIQVEPT